MDIQERLHLPQVLENGIAEPPLAPICLNGQFRHNDHRNIGREGDPVTIMVERTLATTMGITMLIMVNLEALLLLMEQYGTASTF